MPSRKKLPAPRLDRHYDRHASLATVWLKGELLHAAGPLDFGQSVVVGAEHVEQIVMHRQLADRFRANEVHHHGEADRIGRGR